VVSAMGSKETRTAIFKFRDHSQRPI
jgi:hypothetical protein